MGWLGGLFRGGGGELGWDDVIRHVVRAVGVLARRGERGRVVFPPEVVVRIEVAGGGAEVVRGFVKKRELDAEVGAALANEHDCDPAELPRREYVVAAGAETKITAAEGSARAWEIAIEGGDLDGRTVRLPSGRKDARFGRGEWHGKEQQVKNDVVVCESAEFVSRRAGRLTHAGSALEVEALDQGDSLVVRRSSGEAVRPARTSKGRAAVQSGDVVELGDGHGGAIRLHVRCTILESERGPDHA
jgi:hypothetical protein